MKKNFRKYIFLILKTAVAILSFAYIFNQLSQYKTTDFFRHLSYYELLILFIVLLLMFVNWSIESVKWKYLLAGIESIPFLKSIKAVFTGITFAIFTPNRIGELAGRVFVLEKQNRLKGVFATAAGSFSQMMITALFGVIAILFSKLNENNPNSLILIKIIAASVLIFGLLIYFNLKVTIRLIVKINFLRRFNQSIEILSGYTRKKLLYILVLSGIRYIVFFLQFYLLLVVFNVEIGFADAFKGIALTYLFSSVIPSFAIAEIGIRGSAAIFFIGLYSSNITGIISAVALLWIINLAIPAVAGAVFLSFALFEKKP